MTGEMERLTATSVGISVEAVAAAADEGSDGVLAGSGGRTAADASLRRALIHI